MDIHCFLKNKQKNNIEYFYGQTKRSFLVGPSSDVCLNCFKLRLESSSYYSIKQYVHTINFQKPKIKLSRLEDTIIEIDKKTGKLFYHRFICVPGCTYASE